MRVLNAASKRGKVVSDGGWTLVVKQVASFCGRFGALNFSTKRIACEHKVLPPSRRGLLRSVSYLTPADISGEAPLAFGLFLCRLGALSTSRRRLQSRHGFAFELVIVAVQLQQWNSSVAGSSWSRSSKESACLRMQLKSSAQPKGSARLSAGCSQMQGARAVPPSKCV